MVPRSALRPLTPPLPHSLSPLTPQGGFTGGRGARQDSIPDSEGGGVGDHAVADHLKHRIEAAAEGKDLGQLGTRVVVRDRVAHTLHLPKHIRGSDESPLLGGVHHIQQRALRPQFQGIEAPQHLVHQ